MPAVAARRELTYRIFKERAECHRPCDFLLGRGFGFRVFPFDSLRSLRAGVFGVSWDTDTGCTRRDWIAGDGGGDDFRRAECVGRFRWRRDRLNTVFDEPCRGHDENRGEQDVRYVGDDLRDASYQFVWSDQISGKDHLKKERNALLSKWLKMALA